MARILWLISLDDASGTLAQAFENFRGEVPVWYWITFIPQLLTSLSHREAKLAKQVLVRIAKSYPQALHFQLRTTREDLAAQQRQAIEIARQNQRPQLLRRHQVRVQVKVIKKMVMQTTNLSRKMEGNIRHKLNQHNLNRHHNQIRSRTATISSTISITKSCSNFSTLISSSAFGTCRGDYGYLENGISIVSFVFGIIG